MEPDAKLMAAIMIAINAYLEEKNSGTIPENRDTAAGELPNSI